MGVHTHVLDSVNTLIMVYTLIIVMNYCQHAFFQHDPCLLCCCYYSYRRDAPSSMGACCSCFSGGSLPEREPLIRSCPPPDMATHPIETRAKHTSRVSDMRAHQAVGGSPCNHSIPSATLPQERRNGHATGRTMDDSDLGERSEGDEDSGVGSRTQLDAVEGAKPLLARATSNGNGQPFYYPASPAALVTEKGKALKEKIKQAYKWKDRFYQPTQEFLGLMDNMFMECQVHLTLMSTKATPESRAEADTLVEEMIALRNHWGTDLLPVTTCNAFVRERISLTIGLQQYRIDCAQFFEPVPFQTGATQPLAQAMKLFRFSVYDLGKNEIVLRYYLEQSNTANLYHALCYVTSNTKAQVRAYGEVRPGYWEMRQHMLTDVCSRLNSPLTRPRLQ